LSEYAQRFAENDVDRDILRELTDQDLKDLGVSSLGHRRKMLRAIGELTVAAPASPHRPAETKPIPQDTAEHRQLTMMFCDLVGSTALSTQLDPEDLSRIIGAFRDACAHTVAGFGGSVAKYMGDSIDLAAGVDVRRGGDADHLGFEVAGRLKEALEQGRGLDLAGAIGDGEHGVLAGEGHHVEAALDRVGERDAVVIEDVRETAVQLRGPSLAVRPLRVKGQERRSAAEIRR
jgi:class 3 adenylate cyclase